ncbi:uncharacterized protein LOC120330140 isoform X1 [Styela clava]
MFPSCINGMKVICAGFPKTGTKSMARALRLLGYGKVYDFEEAIEYGLEEWGEILLNKSTDMNKVLDQIYSDDVEAVVDFPHSFFFEHFYRKWPNAKVILMIRDEDDQFRSMKNMLVEAKSTYWLANKIMPYLSKTSRFFSRWSDHMLLTAMGSEEPNELKWKQAFRRHNAYVKSVIPEEKLLIYSVSEGWEPLCKFLDKAVPLKEFPFENKAGSKDRIAVKLMTDSKLIRGIKKDLLNICLILPILFAFLAWFCYRLLI